jgi:hypothetical protein
VYTFYEAILLLKKRFNIKYIDEKKLNDIKKAQQKMLGFNI